jgi:hypothetical protein
MGLFDFLRKRTPRDAPVDAPAQVSVPQLCYDAAYFIVPRYVFNDLSKLVAMWRDNPISAGAFFYVMACQLRQVELAKDVALQFKCERGELNREREYLALEYPVPPPVDMSGLSPDQLSNSSPPLVLAPHFSVVIARPDPQYLILGQAPIGGGTTVRSILRDGSNCNLGPGPAPGLPAFLDAIRGWIQ